MPSKEDVPKDTPDYEIGVGTSADKKLVELTVVSKFGGYNLTKIFPLAPMKALYLAFVLQRKALALCLGMNEEQLNKNSMGSDAYEEGG